MAPERRFANSVWIDAVLLFVVVRDFLTLLPDTSPTTLILLPQTVHVVTVLLGQYALHYWGAAVLVRPLVLFTCIAFLADVSVGAAQVYFVTQIEPARRAQRIVFAATAFLYACNDVVLFLRVPQIDPKARGPLNGTGRDIAEVAKFH